MVGPVRDALPRPREGVVWLRGVEQHEQRPIVLLCQTGFVNRMRLKACDRQILRLLLSFRLLAIMDKKNGPITENMTIPANMEVMQLVMLTILQQRVNTP